MAKQFGEEAERVTTREMNLIYNELNSKIGNKFCGFELTRTLEEKLDHGDIDILVLLHPDQNPKSIINSLNPIKSTKNGYCYSFLYRSDLNKKVHVDFLVSSNPNLHATKKQYYALNELSSTIGILAKSLNFKYGSEGFFKRYKDKRNNWHDIVISLDLNIGLQCLDLEIDTFWIKTCNDIVRFVSNSVLFDSSMFDFKEERESKRSNKNYIITVLAELQKKAAVKDEDFFFKKQFPNQYVEVENKKREIEESTYRQSRFNGDWLILNFNIKSGPQIGRLLRLVSDNFGDSLSQIDESEVKNFILGKINDF